ncbi:MAG: GtrA family protein [Fimbriimonadales bacterium]
MGSVLVISPFLEKVAKRKGVRQFGKFVIVGLSSTAIDMGLHAILYKGVNGALNEGLRSFAYGLHPSISELLVAYNVDPAFVLLKALTFVVATLNGFYWNRRWTFDAVDKDRAHKQLIRSYIVYGVGLLINTTVAGSIHHPGAGKWIYVVALLVATVVTTAWTFPMNKFWTFKDNRK